MSKVMGQIYRKIIFKKSRFTSLLSTYLVRFDYHLANKKAPVDERWYNGFCQELRKITEFSKTSQFVSTICQTCINTLE